MKKLKVITVVGTRPEIIRLSRVIAAIDMHCEHVLVHTGQNYDFELNQIFFNDLEIRSPDYFLDTTANSSSPSQTIGNIISAVEKVITAEKPDAMLVLGDTNSCLSVIPAKRNKIPVFHMEAGNRCFDQRVPEEINRRIVDHTADINLCYSDISREYLLREGLPPDQIIKTGSPMYEVLHHNLPKINKSQVLFNLGIQPKEYLVVSTHREENIDPDKAFFKFVKLLNGLAEHQSQQIIVSTHPRTEKRISGSSIKFHSRITFMKPMGFHDYVNLQVNSKVVLSDSGTINEEASILNFPALNLREAHERPEGMEEADVMMVGLDLDRVKQGISILSKHPDNFKNPNRIVADYSMPNVSNKVVRIIHSYTDYVNRVTWKKY